MVILIVALAVWALWCVPLMVMARKVGHELAWLVWVPIANTWLLFDNDEREWWYMLLEFVPLVNIGVTVWVGIGLAETFGQPQWLGILLVVPLLNVALLYYLAYFVKTNVLRY